MHATHKTTKKNPDTSKVSSKAREAFEILKRGAAEIIGEDDLLLMLDERRPLTVKLGVDPTAPDIHLGHTVGLQKLRQFQELGHRAVLIIGDFTAMIGDPSGRSATRPQLTHDEVMENARSYQQQAFKILDPQLTRIVFNGEWFEMMPFEEVIRLNSCVTLQQMLQREDFKERLKNEQPIHAHEIQYPIMQGWDSVKIHADVEIGGTDQLFNIMVGRHLQKIEGMRQQVGLMVPILEGLDGTQKMSKSLGNYVAVNEPPAEMFGKLMSISDELMARYYLLLLGCEMPEGHPMEIKKALAGKIVARYHGNDAAEAARADFETRFSKRDLAAADLPEIAPPGTPLPLVEVVAIAFSQGFGQTRSRSDLRRLIEGGSIQIDGSKVTDATAPVSLAPGTILRLDKKRAVRIGR